MKVDPLILGSELWDDCLRDERLIVEALDFSVDRARALTPRHAREPATGTVRAGIPREAL